MQRYFFEISYNGSSYFGWQIQVGQISVQQVLQDALSKLHSNKTIKIVGCGRTDTGVHAKQYFFHADLDKLKDESGFRNKLNVMLPDDIVVHTIYNTTQDQHARFNAESRTYRYFIHQKKDPFKNLSSCFVAKKLDMNSMNEAAAHLIGMKDFTSFSKLNTDVKTNICTVSRANWVEDSESNLYFEITSDRFLRNMVRAIVGTSIEIGSRKMDADKMKEIIEAQDRQKASASASANGLFLWEVRYSFL